MQAQQNLKRMELNAAAAAAASSGGTNPQQSNTVSVPLGLTETHAVASGLALAQQPQDVLTTAQTTLQILPGQQETLGLAAQVQQGMISLGQAQQRTQGLASLQQGLTIANGNRVNIGLNDQARISLIQQQQQQQQQFPQQQPQQHLIQQFSLQQLQQLQLHRAAASGSSSGGPTPVACTIQSPRLRMNTNLIRTPQQTTTVSNPASQQQQPVVMVTLTQAGHPRLTGVNSYQLQQNTTGSVSNVGQNLAVLHGVPSPQMTASPQQQHQMANVVTSGGVTRQSPMPRHFATNSGATHHFPTLTIHPPNGSGGLTSGERPGSTDTVMLSQLPSTYQMNNDGSITPLTPQDQLSRYVEQL